MTPPDLAFGPSADLAGIAIGPTQIRYSCASVIAGCKLHAVPVVRRVGSSGPGHRVVEFKLTTVRATRLGILIQRLIGTRRVLVGHVPLGLKRVGRLTIRWNLQINGHPLPPGRYLITLRMFDRHGHLIALAHPMPLAVN